jgi:peptidoglycan hydrolase CwlO-like protein
VPPEPGARQRTPDAPAAAPDGTVPPPRRHHRPWGWIAACLLLVLVAGGLAIWALGLQTDLDDQRDQTAQAQQEADQAGKDVKALAGEVEQISQSVSEAGDELSQAGTDAKTNAGEAEQNAQKALDGLGAKVDSLKGKAQKALDDAAAAQDSEAP